MKHMADSSSISDISDVTITSEAATHTRLGRFADSDHRAAAPVLRFSPIAWARLLFLRDYGQTRVAGFGLAPADDPLYVEEIRLVRQRASLAAVRLDQTSVRELCSQDGGTIWIQLHPGRAELPSRQDEQAFARFVRQAGWGVLFLLDRRGTASARLRFAAGPGGEWEIPVEVDLRRPFPGCDVPGWEADYLAHVEPFDGFGGDPHADADLAGGRGAANETG
jgi:hypothetical protein